MKLNQFLNSKIDKKSKLIFFLHDFTYGVILIYTLGLSLLTTFLIKNKINKEEFITELLKNTDVFSLSWFLFLFFFSISYYLAFYKERKKIELKIKEEPLRVYSK